MKRLFYIFVFVSVLIPIGAFCQKNSTTTEEAYTKARQEMVENQLVSRDITDTKVLAAMKKVPRHKFVPPEHRLMAYSDRPLPIDKRQTISQPYIVALMTQLIEPDRNQKVLEIGTGSGYAAAILAEIVGEVYTIEIEPALAKSAGELLKQLGYRNIHVKHGDGFFGWGEAAPFDAIIITCSTERIPPKLAQQLKQGGRMILPLGNYFSVQNLTIVTKREDKLVTEPIAPVRFVPMTGEALK